MTDWRQDPKFSENCELELERISELSDRELLQELEARGIPKTIRELMEDVLYNDYVEKY